jgi:hypothetical protein
MRCKKIYPGKLNSENVKYGRKVDGPLSAVGLYPKQQQKK